MRDCANSGVPIPARQMFQGAGHGPAREERRPDGTRRHLCLDPVSCQPDALRCRIGPLTWARRGRRARSGIRRVADRKCRWAKPVSELVRPHSPGSGCRSRGGRCLRSVAQVARQRHWVDRCAPARFGARGRCVPLDSRRAFGRTGRQTRNRIPRFPPLTEEEIHLFGVLRVHRPMTQKNGFPFFCHVAREPKAWSAGATERFR